MRDDLHSTPSTDFVLESTSAKSANMATPGTATDFDLPNPENPKLQVTHEGEHHGDFGDVQIKITWHNYLFAFCAAVNSCNLGYDIGVSTEAGQYVQSSMNLTTVQREILLGSINWWAIFGALGAQWFSDRFGRRITFIVAAVGFIIGVIIMAAAPNYNVLMFGRSIVGIGVGVGLAIDPLYIAEVTPAKRRGELVTWSEIAINVGLVIGFSTGLMFTNMADDLKWRYMFGLGGVLPFIMIILVLTIMPESPRWLVSKGRDSEARQILAKVYPPGFDVELVVNDIKEAIEREETAEHATGWGVLFAPTPAFRRMLLVGIGTAIAQQAVGVDAIQYYMLDIIQASSLETTRQDGILVVLGLIKLVFIIVGGKLFDRTGRRPLFFVSLLGMTVALLVVSFAFFFHPNLSGGFTVFGLGVYVAFFSIGMGPGAWLVPSEVFATCIRAKAMSLATFANRIVATIMSSTFLSTGDAMGWGGFFLLLAVICLMVLAFLYTYLPETKGRSLEDMSIYFAEITGDKSILEEEARIIRRREEKKTKISSGDAEASPLQSEGAEVL